MGNILSKIAEENGWDIGMRRPLSPLKQNNISTDSACEPIAWALMQPDSYSVFISKDLAEKKRELCMGGDVVPLYHHQQFALTDTEKEALRMSVREWNDSNDKAGWEVAYTIQGILKRLG